VTPTDKQRGASKASEVLLESPVLMVGSVLLSPRGNHLAVRHRDVPLRGHATKGRRFEVVLKENLSRPRWALHRDLDAHLKFVHEREEEGRVAPTLEHEES
jgi:hypothetical protein